jgi:hypothetical protein
MATVKAGVVTALEVNGPVNNPTTKLADPGSGGFWAAVWFVVAIVLLFVVL